ncbi:MAG: NAD-dependent epimerase/dehydratase family protein [Beijerinckiaceae bacterium]|nr:NAD-dependent epimerase/dehydratase family protein [Beijerinckiaceae bacterium]
MRFLITGAAGFIGFHLARRLLADGHFVAGVDGLTPYYDVNLKRARLALLARSNGFRFHELMLEDFAALRAAGEDARPDVIVHLAAQAGVRYSIENPRSYAESNLTGSFNLLEVARMASPRHLLFASTSSVYGANTQMPFRETDRTDHPLTFYAATKKASEDMAHSYAHLWSLPTTAFRFFTVYGPWGRPDMALFKFVKAALAGETIDVYGHGKMRRDFTYVDDLVEAIVRLVDRPPEAGKPVGPADSLSPAGPYRVVNIGGGAPVELSAFIDEIEQAVGVPIAQRMLDIQPGELPATWASADLLEALTGYVPGTPLDAGVAAFVRWYREQYGI